MSIVPDTRDWTFVLERPCSACGLDTAALSTARFSTDARGLGARWAEMLRRLPADELRRRPRPDRWSRLEYGCHVRDVYRRMDGRIALLLAEDDPTFANWDQDATAVEDRYGEQDPLAVADELEAAAAAIAARFADIGPLEWERPGRRSNGSRFTVESLGRYFFHDVIHHLADVGEAMPAPGEQARTPGPTARDPQGGR